MRTLLAVLASSLLSWACASDCDTICGKLELCSLDDGYDRDACLDRCEEEPGGSRSDGLGGAGGAGGTAGAGGLGGGGGAGGEGGSPPGAEASTENCAACVDQLGCSQILDGACDELCPASLRP